MSVQRRDYVAVKGYVFERKFRAKDGLVIGWDFRFTIFVNGGSDIVAMAGNGMTLDEAAGEWVFEIPIDQLAVGEHKCSHDYKIPDGNWKQASTGEFRLTDPRAIP